MTSWPANWTSQGSAWGKQPVAVFAGTLMVSHLNNHCGEVSSMKGIQGAKGYPF